MEFSIALATPADSWKIVERAEELGFDAAWFYDTQMLSADCFVAMGACAVKTKRIRLGTGVLIPTNRIAPVTANAFASLNQLAPGRIDFGVGTGFTGRRAMGLGAMKLADMEEYIRVVYGLLADEIVEATFEDKTRKIKFLNPDLGLINITDAVPLHVSAYGPRSRALTAKLKAGWLYFVENVEKGVDHINGMKQAWADAGNAEPLQANGFINGCVLADGEPFDSDRAMAQAGPRAAVVLHRAADEEMMGLPNSSGIPPAAAAAVSAYVERAKSFEPSDARYLMNHRGHLMFVKPEEREMVTGELIRDMTFTGTRDVLVEQFEALKAAGYTQFTVQLMPGHEHAIEDWAEIMKIVR